MVTNYEWDRPGWLPAREWTPAEDWARITGRQAPYWEARQPMRQLGQRLQARYLLGAPEMFETQTGEPTFQDYIGYGESGNALTPGSMAWRAGTYDDLLARARAAAAATRDPAGEYMSAFVPETDPWRQAAWYTGMFNPMGGGGSQAAVANQLAVATLLAQQQRGGGGAYTGALGRAISQAMENVQQYRQDLGDPQGSFLDWYLGQLPEAPVGG
jgi:hypothetical protein